MISKSLQGVSNYNLNHFLVMFRSLILRQDHFLHLRRNLIFCHHLGQLDSYPKKDHRRHHSLNRLLDHYSHPKYRFLRLAALLIINLYLLASVCVLSLVKVFFTPLFIVLELRKPCYLHQIFISFFYYYSRLVAQFLTHPSCK